MVAGHLRLPIRLLQLFKGGLFIVALQKLNIFAIDDLQLTCGIQHKNFLSLSKLNTEKHQGQDVK